jgi:hypothetical protein
VQLASAHLQNRLKLAATTTATVLRRISLTLSLSLSFSSLSLSLLSLKLQQKVQQLRWWMQLLTVGTFHFFAFSVFAAKHHFAFIG